MWVIDVVRPHAEVRFAWPRAYTVGNHGEVVPVTDLPHPRSTPCGRVLAQLSEVLNWVS